MGMNDNDACLLKVRITAASTKCTGSSLWCTSLRCWVAPACSSLLGSEVVQQILKFLTPFVSWLKRRPEWLAQCCYFRFLLVCQVIIGWGRNGDESHQQPEIKGRHHYGPWLWSGCSPETQASGGAWGTSLGKHFRSSAAEKPPCKGTLLWVFRTTSARICIPPERMFSPFACCCSGQDVYVQTVLISSWGRKVVVSKRVASLLPSFPALCSLATGPGWSSYDPIKSQSLDK